MKLLFSCSLNSKFDAFNENDYVKVGEVKDSIKDIWTVIYLHKADKDFLMHKSYYHTGNLKDVFFFNRNKVHGKVKTYYESGKLQSITHYKYGVIHGKMYIYYENGEIQSISDYKHGVKESIIKFDSMGNQL